MQESIKQSVDEIKHINRDMKIIILVTKMVSLEDKLDRAEMADIIIDLFTDSEGVSEK